MAVDRLDALEWLRKHLEQDNPDLLREMVRSFAEQLMSAEADAVYRAGYGERRAKRSQLARRLPPPRFSTPEQARSTWPCPNCGKEL